MNAVFTPTHNIKNSKNKLLGTMILWTAVYIFSNPLPPPNFFSCIRLELDTIYVQISFLLYLPLRLFCHISNSPIFIISCSYFPVMVHRGPLGFYLCINSGRVSLTHYFFPCSLLLRLLCTNIVYLIIYIFIEIININFNKLYYSKRTLYINYWWNWLTFLNLWIFNL